MLHRVRLVFRTLVSAIRVIVRRCWRKTKGGSGSSAALLPTYAQSPGSKSASASSGGHGLTGFSMRELKMMFKHFMSDKTSLRIFAFLCINFLFMFVELIYGFYSNSLGLISDAGHMLFDCVCAGTPITMSDGTSRPIEDVQAGDSVLALDSNDALVPRQVHHRLLKGIRACVELMLEDGRTLIVTAEHKIRTMEGTWIAAKDLAVGETRVALGVDAPVSRLAVGADSTWSFAIKAINATLNLNTHRVATLAFVRLLGYLLTDGSIGRDAVLYVGHRLDAEAVQRDIQAVCGIRAAQAPCGKTIRIHFPARLRDAFLEVGAQPGARVSQVSHLPAFLLVPSCPRTIVVEFLGGLFGGDGRTVYVSRQKGRSAAFHGVGFIAVRDGTAAQPQVDALRAELFPLLSRAGIDTTAINVSVNTGVTGVTEAGRDEIAARKDTGQQLSHKVDIAEEELENDTSYNIQLDFASSLTLAFHSNIGFRYSCHKAQRLAAAVCWYRAAELVRRQRAWIADKCKSIAGSVPSRLAAAKAALSLTEQLHPAVVAWQCTKEARLGLLGPLIAPFTQDESLSKFGITDFFSEKHKNPKYNSASSSSSAAAAASERVVGQEEGKTAMCLCDEWNAECERPVCGECGGQQFVDPLPEPDEEMDAAARSRDRVTYGVVAGASGLPLFFATVVGRRAVGDRAVYDLVVPSGIEGKDIDSFMANGTVVHNCTALGIGLYASFVSKLKPNHRYTYGYARYEILSGYVNAVFLLFIGYFIFVESVERLFRPPEITSDSLVLVSVLGLMVNMVGLFFFHDHGSHGHSHAGPGGGHGHAPVAAAPAASSAHQDAAGGDHGHSHGGTACGGHGGNAKANQAAEAQKNSNMLAIYLHIMADALGSVGVIISSLLVQYKGWTSADAICSIIISVLIVASVMPLIWSTLDVLNQRTPIFKEALIRDTLAAMTQPGGEFEAMGVVSYREPHFWAFSDSETIGTLHVQVREVSLGGTVSEKIGHSPKRSP